MLTPAAQKVIANYLALPFENAPQVPCPYFNNKKSEVHGGLRATIGKGNPEDIVEEAVILSLQNKIDLSKLSSEELTKFLVDHHLGVDCSAFVYYVLDAELQARGKGRIKNNFVYPKANFIRKLLIKLRTAENTNVKVFADDANSKTISLSEIQPGDIITMIGSGREHDRDHMLLIHDISSPPERRGQGEVTISYSHSLEWRTDGKYHHGVRQGTITITNTSKPITEAVWTERGKSGDENETLERAKFAEKLEVRRLKCI